MDFTNASIMYGASIAALCVTATFISFFVLWCFLCCSDLYEFDSLEVPGSRNLEFPNSRDLEVSGLRDLEIPDSRDLEVPGSRNLEVPGSKNLEFPDSQDLEVPGSRDLEVPETELRPKELRDREDRHGKCRS